jgi:hypothetical protein
MLPVPMDVPSSRRANVLLISRAMRLLACLTLRSQVASNGMGLIIGRRCCPVVAGVERGVLHRVCGTGQVCLSWLLSVDAPVR